MSTSNKECYDAEYTNSMSKTNKDDLLDQEMLVSSNCNYILIRNPPTILSFYSIPDSYLIYQWNITDSIWSINDEHFPNTESIYISNSGCLLFNNTKICMKNTSTTTTSTFTTQSVNKANADLISLHGNNTIDKLDNNLAIIIPSILCFIGIFCIIIFLLCHRFRKRNYNHIFDDSIGGESHSISSLSDINEYSSNENINNQARVSDQDEEVGYIETEFEEHDDEIDLSDCTPVSHDLYRTISTYNEHSDRVVTQKIVSASIASPMSILTRNKSISTSTDFNDDTSDLIVPNMLLTTSETHSDLDIGSHVDNTLSELMKRKLGQKLSTIKDEWDVNDNIIVRDQSLENQSSDIDDSSCDEEENIE